MNTSDMQRVMELLRSDYVVKVGTARPSLRIQYVSTRVGAICCAQLQGYRHLAHRWDVQAVMLTDGACSRGLMRLCAAGCA